MRFLILLSGGVLAALAFCTRPAAAQTYPWCYVEYGRDAPGPSCGYVSRAQCELTARGTTGHCEANYNYQPTGSIASEPPPHRKRRHTHQD